MWIFSVRDFMVQILYHCIIELIVSLYNCIHNFVFVKIALSQKSQYIFLKDKRSDDPSSERLDFTSKLDILGIGL